MIAEPYQPVIAQNVVGALCYMGIDEDTPLGKMIDTTFNLRYTTTAAILPQNINISTWDPFFLTAIYFLGKSGIYLKPYDGEGDEIFSDFFLQTTAGSEPFPIKPYPFNPNDLLRFDTLDTNGGGNNVEVAFRGFTLALG